MIAGCVTEDSDLQQLNVWSYRSPSKQQHFIQSEIITELRISDWQLECQCNDFVAGHIMPLEYNQPNESASE